MKTDWKILLCIELLCLVIVILSGCDAYAYPSNEEADVGRVATQTNDASVVLPKIDASTEVDISEDLATTPHPMELLSDSVQVLSEAQCNGSSLHLSDTSFRAGYTAWHLCFEVYDLCELAGDDRDLRVEAVQFYVGHDPSLALESIAQVASPPGRHEWMANIVVALPTDWGAPRFNVRQVIPEGPPSVEWSLDGDGYGSLRQFGRFYAWRVDRSGHQADVSLHPVFSVCGGLTRPMNFPAGNFVPEGRCPMTLMSCPSTGEYYCSK